MRTGKVITDESFQGFNILPNHYKAELPWALGSWCTWQNLRDTRSSLHQWDSRFMEESTELLFLAGAYQDLENSHDHLASSLHVDLDMAVLPKKGDMKASLLGFEADLRQRSGGRQEVDEDDAPFSTTYVANL